MQLSNFIRDLVVRYMFFALILLGQGNTGLQRFSANSCENQTQA